MGLAQIFKTNGNLCPNYRAHVTEYTSSLQQQKIYLSQNKNMGTDLQVGFATQMNL